MLYRPLGTSSLKVSALCLGTMTWGEQNTQRDAFAQIDRARDAGVNFIDCAEMYPVPPRCETQGDSHRIIGESFRQRGNRDQWVLASKVAGPSRDMHHIRDGATCFTRQYITGSMEGSLMRLQSEHIDL